jgi:hypothetical protein
MPYGDRAGTTIRYAVTDAGRLTAIVTAPPEARPASIVYQVAAVESHRCR